jgi:two-component system chemotaxis response regulator CheB
MIQALIVHREAEERQRLRALLAPGVTVCAESEGGAHAVELARTSGPKVVLLESADEQLDTLRALTAAGPAPVVMLAAGSSPQQIEDALHALELGAAEVLPGWLDGDSLRQAVLGLGAPRPPDVPGGKGSLPATARALTCVGLAASLGGPAALQRILRVLPSDFPLPILIAQQLPPGFAAPLASWLANQCPLDVRLAEAGEALSPGTVLIADGAHLMLSMGRVRLDAHPPIRGARPSANALFTSLAKELSTAAAGVLLTGSGDDGAAGLQLMRERGGLTLVQDPAECSAFERPRAALERRAADAVLGLEEIGPALAQLGRKELFRSRRRKRLLLVDDAETILQLEQLVLGRTYDIYLARDGQQALEVAERVQPDGILLDYAMPVMSGAQALKKLKAEPRTQSIPVILVTSQKDPKLLRSCEEDGCAAIVPKPIDQKTLIATVQRWVPP